MVKHQICITIDEDTLLKTKERLRDGVFRNKSHFFEFAAKKLLEESQDRKRAEMTPKSNILEEKND
ncbi:MAG: hypothetical protein ABIA62_05915 [Candidatus Woesearchaeota archaeon]